MEPDPNQKRRGRPESPSRRVTRGEVPQTTTYLVSSTPSQGHLPGDIISQHHFSRSLHIPGEQSEKQKQPKRASTYAFEHLHHVPQLQLQPVSLAFMPPGKTEHNIEGPTWQHVDSARPGPSGTFASPGLHPSSKFVPSHTSVIPGEDSQSTQSVYGHHSAQVPLKLAEEVHKKEKKPQKLGKYICQYCGRPCAKPSVLQKHIRSHTGERPYPCIPCGFSFKTKSNLYKHRKSHAHRIKAGLASGARAETYPPSLETERVAGDELEEPTEEESTDSEDEIAELSGQSLDLTFRQKHTSLSSSSLSVESPGTSHEPYVAAHLSESQSLEESTQFAEPTLDHSLSHKADDSHTIKQKLALRLNERKKVVDEQTQAFLSPGSKGSTESGYFSRSESAEQQISPPNTNAKSYAEIILGKYGRIGQRTTVLSASATQGPQQTSAEETASGVPFLPKTQVIEHITKLITINEAVVDTSEIDSVKPRRTSLSRRSSIESPKSSTYRDPFQSQTERTKYEHLLLSIQQGHGATETVPLLRSHSMPSAASTISSPHTFRVSHSFDDRVMESDDVFSHGHAFSSHPRLLKRQPAIELPLGMEYSSEESGSLVKETGCKSSEEQEPGENDPSRRSRKGTKVKGLMYECNRCGARYKKRDNYETHKKYYCSELHPPRSHSSGSQLPSETGQVFSTHDTRPKLMHYKLSTRPETTPLRKRRKEKSLGDDEDPAAFESMVDDTSNTTPVVTLSAYGIPAPSEVVVNITGETVRSQGDLSECVHIEETVGQHVKSSAEGSPNIAQPLSKETTDRRTTGKVISVIQHTSSFEKSESIEHLSSLEGEEMPPTQYSSPSAVTHPRSFHSLQPKLVRQHKIQVPEILVTEEPDRPDNEPEPPAKEQEKTEEFQWPQRSQTLSQLPAEKLPPKKKRLRLAEMAQSSGESSFESVSLTRSPSQESGVSYGSSHSASFEREEHSKPEAPGPPSELLGKPVGTHMLTVPSHHHSHREMRRSASEQAPSAPHSSQISEARSKSFDYGNLSSTTSPVGSSPPPSLRGRGKCFLVRQASLSKHPEGDQDVGLKSRQDTEEQMPSSSKSPVKSKSSPLHSPPSRSISEHPVDIDQQISSSQLVYTQPSAEALQVFQQQLPHEKQYRPTQLPLFPVQQILQQSGESTQLFPSQGLSEVLTTRLSLPQVPHSYLQAPQLPLPQALLPSGHLQVTHQFLPPQTEIPFPRHLPLTHMQYPGSSVLPPAVFLPLQSQLAVDLQTEVGGPFTEQKIFPSVSPPAGSSSLSPCTAYSMTTKLCTLPVSTTSLVSSSSSTVSQPICAPSSDPIQPVVSFVVPVRIQTHMPSYGSAMYTTLSQILVNQSQGIPSTVVMCRAEDRVPTGALVCSAAVHELGSHSLSQMIAEGPKGLLQTPYLRVPLPIPEQKGYMPLTSPTEGILGMEGGPSGVGGSKRMLSPAGSLELTMEMQQQKRVKEEEDSEAEEKVELLKSPSAMRQSPEEEGEHPKRYLMRQCINELESLPTSTTSEPECSPKLTIYSPSLALQTMGTLHSKTTEEYQLQSGKQYKSEAPLETLKKEDLEEIADPAKQVPSTSLTESGTVESAAKSQEGTGIKKVLQFSGLHTTTNVSWCYLNYIKPNHAQQVDRRSSVYASWCISLYNPNIPGISTKVALALLRSKQRSAKETYTMATAPRLDTGKLVTSSSRKPKMTEVRLPSLHLSEVKKEPKRTEKEEEKRVKQEEETTATKRGEPARIKIFEGGYKSNEEYVYVRGRGRGKYVCEECGIRCKKPSMLKKHIRTHTDVRPYVCKYCNFAFKTKGNLTKHMKSKAHSKKCQEMGVSATTIEELESEEGTSEDRPIGSEERDESELVEEHQFSDLEESDDDDDNDDEDDDDEEESQDEPLSKSSPQPHSSSSIPVLGEGVSTTSISTTETTWPTESFESRESTTCKSSSRFHRLAFTSSERLVSPEKETSTRQQMLLGVQLSPSREASPKRRWSPSSESPSGSSRPSLSRKHLLTKSETSSSSPRRFSPSGDVSPLRCLSPGRGISPSRHLSPGRDLSPVTCSSPRLELSPSRHLSPRRELSPRVHVSPSREMPSTKYLSLRRMLSPSGMESPTTLSSPGKEELPWSSASGGEEKTQGSTSGLRPGPWATVGPSQRAHGKDVETCELKMVSTKRESKPPSWEGMSRHPFCLRLPQTSAEEHLHTPARTEDNIFSHLPLHSQQLARAPYPMIPIGGIQMVQSRPSTHASLTPSSVTSLQTDYLIHSGGDGHGTGSVDFSQSVDITKEQQAEGETSPQSPEAKISKFSNLFSTRSDHAKETARTSKSEAAEEEAAYKGTVSAETSHSPGEPTGSDSSPSTIYKHFPKPSTSGEGTSKGKGKKQCGKACTFTPEPPAQTLDRSSSTGCLTEPLVSHSLSHQSSARRRNFSGE
uniref:HIVEP zinc finger 3 n=1 Tax=Latimeria chalumnae TaxID=7897 RepID=H3B8H9_LATCH